MGYSDSGDAWNYFSHDQARSRAYRWGDGLGGICDDRQLSLDSTPTHSYMKYLYKYPQAAFLYADLVGTNTRPPLRYHVFEATSR